MIFVIAILSIVATVVSFGIYFFFQKRLIQSNRVSWVKFLKWQFFAYLVLWFIAIALYYLLNRELTEVSFGLVFYGYGLGFGLLISFVISSILGNRISKDAGPS